MISAPADVRFAGEGFMALTAGAKAPWGLGYERQGARAFVPLHLAVNASGCDEAGEISVLPLRIGEQTISWAGITAGVCGEHGARRLSERDPSHSGAARNRCTGSIRDRSTA